jgi:hypothetical protein
MIIITSSPIKWKIGAELIKFYQKTEFSHVAIVRGNLVFQASHGHVNCMHIDIFLQDNKVIDKFKVPDCAIDMNFVYHQLGKPYSYVQILEIAFKFVTGIKAFKNNGNNQFICSEFVGKSLQLDWVNDYTSPKEIADYLRSLEKK